MSVEREQIERRQKDRRSSERRSQHYICDKCGNDLIYLLPEKLLSNECYECRGCGQKFVVLKFKGKRNQLARVNNV